jgi:hypothetical protein
LATDTVRARLREHARNDREGNLLLFKEDAECPTKPTHENQNLHAMWDDCLMDFVTGPERCVTHTTDQHVDSLAAWLIKQMREAGSHAYRSIGDYHQWPEE